MGLFDKNYNKELKEKAIDLIQTIELRYMKSNYINDIQNAATIFEKAKKSVMRHGKKDFQFLENFRIYDYKQFGLYILEKTAQNTADGLIGKYNQFDRKKGSYMSPSEYKMGWEGINIWNFTEEYGVEIGVHDDKHRKIHYEWSTSTANKIDGYYEDTLKTMEDLGLIKR